MANAGEHKNSIWTPANIVTMIRICFIPVFVVALISPWPEWFSYPAEAALVKPWVAAIIFIVLALTDTLDGYLARSRNEITTFGKLIDPIADKMLVAAALIALVELGVLPSWVVLVILAREFIVSGIRMIAAAEGFVIAASMYGKVKTVLQMIAIVMFIIKDSLKYIMPMDTWYILYAVSWAVMIAAVVMTVFSLCDYLYKARSLFGFVDAQVGVGDSQDCPDSALEGTDSSVDVNDSASVIADTIGAGYSIEDLQNENCKLAQLVIDRAIQQGVTIATAESLTGGLIAATLTAVPGSSAVIHGGIVSYTNDVKNQVLSVDADVLSTRGAVSEETVFQMAAHARVMLDAEIAVSVSGIAGPASDETQTPVGTVWMSLACADSNRAQMFSFRGNREQIRLQTVRAALNELLKTME